MKSEIKIGITVFLAAVVAIIGFRFMTDIPIFRTSQEVTTTFDRADGLNQGSQVFIKGVRVGSVTKIELNEENRVDVRLRIDIPGNLPRGSVAFLTSLSLIDGKAIVIELGDSTERIEFGEQIEGRYVEGTIEALTARGEEIGDDLSETFVELKTFLRQLNETLDDDTQANLDRTAENVARATGQISELLEGKKEEIDRALESGSSMLSQLDTLATENRPRIDNLIISLEQNISELEKTRLEIESASTNLNEILDKINRGEGTFGKLVNDPSIYDNLDEMIKEMNTLVKNVNENPGRYLKHMSIIEIF